ncbi:hypothetical protein BSZ05_01105 [Vibrio mediterranei]|uniref:Uncharacterized protein n=1 Tax=Vibrio mediterranei TaxID=689 RepID=A0AAN1FDL3_9VIBR|nr:hypothetical protein BSZ05_01105 [Vibrio mediterranei]
MLKIFSNWIFVGVVFVFLNQRLKLYFIVFKEFIQKITRLLSSLASLLPLSWQANKKNSPVYKEKCHARK